MVDEILVTGANGQLGRSIAKFSSGYNNLHFTFVTRKQLNLNDLKSIECFFQDKTFDVIINCAAYTSVDKAESEPLLVNQINHLAVKQLGEICKVQNIKLIHISTDYVFNGRNFMPYLETDTTAPQNVYGISKLNGENALQKIKLSGIIIRTGWLYSEFGSNFSNTILRFGKARDSLNVVFDQVGTPTYASDLAKAILDIIQHLNFKGLEGMNVYHYSNEGVASWYDFTKTIFELGGVQCLVTPVESKNYNVTAKRPYYSVLNKIKVKQDYNLAIPYWKDSMKKMLELEKE